MKKLLSLLLLLVSVASFGQSNAIYNNVTAKNSITINGTKIKAVKGSGDSLCSASYARQFAAQGNINGNLKVLGDSLRMKHLDISSITGSNNEIYSANKIRTSSLDALLYYAPMISINATYAGNNALSLYGNTVVIGKLWKNVAGNADSTVATLGNVKTRLRDIPVSDSIVIKNTTNSVRIDTTFGIKLTGNATCWDDDNLDPTTLTGTGTAPVATTWSATGISIAGFAKGDEVQGTREIRHNVKLGAPIYFHAHWAANTTNVGNVRLGLEYFFTRDGVAVTTSTTITLTAATDGTAWKKFNTSFAAITPPASELGMQFHFRFYRINEGADTYTGLVLCSTIGYHFEIDGLGSKQITAK